MEIRWIKTSVIAISLLFLMSCSSIDNKTDYGYLDDNYSDRWDLAKQLLGKEVVYFDASNYHNLGQVVSTGDGYNQNIVIKAHRSSDLLTRLHEANEKGGKLAVSGILSSEAFVALVSALRLFKGEFNMPVTILYIGDSRYKTQLQLMVEAKGAVFLYAQCPPTSA